MRMRLGIFEAPGRQDLVEGRGLSTDLPLEGQGRSCQRELESAYELGMRIEARERCANL